MTRTKLMLISKKFQIKKLLKRLADLQLAIFLLFVIGITTALGTFIEQNQSLNFYKENYPDINPIFGFVDWKFILFFNFDNIYGSFWFVLLLLFFTSSLIACTFTTQLPSLKKFRLWQFFGRSSLLKTFPLKGSAANNLTNILFYDVYRIKFHTFRQGKKNYAYTGLLGRIGPIIVHFNILVLAIGVILGSLGGYNTQQLVPCGETFHLQNLVKSNNLSRIPQQFLWRVNDFWITYTAEEKINQFYSDLSILNSAGLELARKTIFVNEPLTYKGITVYQTDWDIVGIKVQVNNKRVTQLPVQKITKSGRNFWLGTISVKSIEGDNKNLTILLNGLNGEVYLYNERGILLNQFRIGEENIFAIDNTIIVKELLASTGLQFKSDPGIGIVYLSFLFIIYSIYISFLSYSQIWGVESNEDVFIAAKSNREVLLFQEEFKKLIAKLGNF